MTEHLANSLSGMSIEDQLDAFCKNTLLSEPFIKERDKLVQQELLTLIRARYPKCTLHPCGMDFIGIGNCDDPVHVYVDLFDNVFSTQKQPWETNSAQHWAQVFQILKGESDNLRFCCKVSKTADRISFQHVESGVQVELRLSGYAIVQEAVLIKFFCSLDPRVRPLLALARYWACENKIFHSIPEENNDNRGRLSVLLMLFHLMNRNIIPTLAKLQSHHQDNNAPSLMIHEGVDLSFCADKASKLITPPNPMLLEDKSIMTLSAMSLLQDFLQRFGIASLKENAVSLWYGKFIKKQDLLPQNQHWLPDDFAKKLHFGPDGEILKQKFNPGDSAHPFCIQDLFDSTLNLGINIDLEELKKFQTTAWKTGEKLERVLNSSSPCIMNIFLTTAEDEAIEKEQELEKQQAFQEMHKQVQQEQQRLIEMKKKATELEERKRQAMIEAEAIRRQHLREEEELKRRKNREEEHERQRQRDKDKEEEERQKKRPSQVEDNNDSNDFRHQQQGQQRHNHNRDFQRERDEERQRLIKSEEEEQRRFVQRQQAEQRLQKQQREREALDRQREEALEHLKESQKQRLEEEQARLERLRAKQFEHDQWKLSQQTQQNNQNPQPPNPPPPAPFSYNNMNKGGGGNGRRRGKRGRTSFGDSSTNPNLLPLGNRNNNGPNHNNDNGVIAGMMTNNNNNLASIRLNYQQNQNPYDNDNGDSSQTRSSLKSATPPDQVRRDPGERGGVGGISNNNALAAKGKNMEENDWLNTEWELFSKSLEQPTTMPVSSFLNMHQRRPTLQVPQPPKPILRNPQQQQQQQQQQHFNPPLPPVYGGQPYYGGPRQGISSVAAAKGPLHYDGSVNEDGQTLPKKRRSSEFLESESSEDSSSESESEGEETEEEEEEEKEVAGKPPTTQKSRLHNPFPIPKIKLCPHVKNFFMEAAADKDFAYGIRGKLQTLYVQFMKEFNNRFWNNCFGFSIELDPTYQDTSPADYAKFGERKSTNLTELLSTIPCFEENFTTTFFCQSTGKLSPLLTHAQPNDLRNGKFIRKQATPLLKVLMDEVPPRLVETNQNLRFKVEVNIILDYDNLNKDCHPCVKIVFDKGLSTQNEMLALFRFFGKLYQRMASRFLSYCIKRWLVSCIDVDLKAIERKCILIKHQNIASGKTTSRKERRKIRRLKRAEKKKQKKMMEFQASSWAASSLPPRNNIGGVGASYGMSSQMNQLSGRGRIGYYGDIAPPPPPPPPRQAHSHQFLQQNQNFDDNPDQQGMSSRGNHRFVPGRGKTFTVPSGWNRTMGGVDNNTNNSTANLPSSLPRLPPLPPSPYSNNTTNNNMMYRRHF